MRLPMVDLNTAAGWLDRQPHDPFLRQAILTSEFVGNAPGRIVLLGAQVHRVKPGTQRSWPTWA